MRLITCKYNGVTIAGVLADDQVIVKAEGDDAIYAVRQMIEQEQGATPWLGGDATIPLNAVKLLAPIPEPRRNIFCVGLNYHDHAKEYHASDFDKSDKPAIPSAPVIFTKATTSVIGPDAPIRSDLDYSKSVDYECELCVVVKKTAHQVKAAAAEDYIFGYTLLNDVTARQIQQDHNQWFLGKSLDSFAPMGPAIVTPDELPDMGSRQISTTVNDELRQQSTLSQLIFDIPTLIETLTKTMTLLPGDIIATGTPVGVGLGFTPPKFLKAGDHVTVSFDGIGDLSNPVI